MEQLRRPSLALVLVVLATVLALASAVHSGGHMWDHLTGQRSAYARYTDAERRHAPIEALGLGDTVDVFDFFKQYLDPRDRYYLQVRESGFSQYMTYQTAFSYAARWYFLPARQALDLKDATVVVSFFEDPKDLHVRYITQQQAGLQPFYVSRIKAP